MLRLTAAMFVAALTATLAGPAPALADPVPWTMAPCATATLGNAVRDRSVAWFVISGEAVQCAPAVAGGGVRIAVYPAGGETGYSQGFNVRLFDFADVGVSREFGAAVVGTSPGEDGVCVLAGEHSRIACVRVTVAEDRTTARTERIDVNDPLVAKELHRLEPYAGSVYPPDGKGMDPTCGTCF
ncbi:hypothetical protein WEI85_05050 [Actinomycetes bacterium KLBMP 9797]